MNALTSLPSKRQEYRLFYASYLKPALLLLVVGVSIVLVEWLYSARGNSFEPDQPSAHDYRAVSPMEYDDINATNRIKELAERSVATVLVRNISASERMKTRLADLRDMQNWAKNTTFGLPPELVNVLRNISDDQRQMLLMFVNRIGDSYFTSVVSEDFSSPTDNTAFFWSEIDKLNLPPSEGNVIYQLLTEVVDSSYKSDPKLTSSVREDIRESIPPVKRKLEVGDIIVKEGEVITPQVGRLLMHQGYVRNEFPLAQLIVVCILMLILPLWLDISSQEVQKKSYSWRSIVFVISVGWICQTIAVHMGVPGAGGLASVTVAYLCMPRRLAFNVSLVGVAAGVFIIIGLSAYNMLLLFVSGFITAITGYYVLQHIDSREVFAYRLIMLTLLLSAVKILILWMQGFPLSLSLSTPLGETWRRGASFFFFDLATTFLLVSALPMIEDYIDALSVLRIRELSHPSSPILRKLQAEAPGTYHHCLMIGALAEAVAEELDLDENLLKMGAYYHDIGKLRRPRYFVENQLGRANPHDELSPALSDVTIISHVADGVELANDYRLPQKVKEFITEHHGTTCLRYFYKKALAEGQNVELEQFCYPGPKPQSKETAILMILDSLEAAMRAESSNIKTVNDIQEVIDNVIELKFQDHQFDDVDFSFKDITKIKTTLLKAFQSMYHTRKVKEIEKRL